MATTWSKSEKSVGGKKRLTTETRRHTDFIGIQKYRHTSWLALNNQVSDDLSVPLCLCGSDTVGWQHTLNRIVNFEGSR